MMRKDIKMTPKLESFLNFDLGHMCEENFNNKILDINYYDNLCLDIYYPDNKADKYPVFIIIYGGGWVSGFKRDKFVEPMLKPLKHGYACVVLDYTLAIDAAFPKSIIDIKMGIDWVHKNAEKYNLNSENINIWGESAGGHLALEAALVDNDLLNIKANTKVNNMFIFYPLTNALTVDNYPSALGKNLDPDSVFGIYMGDALYDQQQLKLVSPIYHLHEKMPALFLQHGQSDNLVPHEQSLEIIEKMKRYPNVKFYYEIAKGKEHTDPYFFTDENVAKMISFIENGI